jgi:hypothetical protein
VTTRNRSGILAFVEAATPRPVASVPVTIIAAINRRTTFKFLIENINTSNSPKIIWDDVLSDKIYKGDSRRGRGEGFGLKKRIDTPFAAIL